MNSDTDLTLLLSDGQANVGETDLEVVGNLAKNAADTGVTVSTLGVGAEYNEALMTEIATQGKGRFYHVQSADEIVPYMTGELGEAADLAARDVKIHIQLPKGAALIPLSAAYTCEIINNKAVISIGDIPADLEVEVPLRLTLFSGKENARIPVEGEITYLSPAGENLKTGLNQVTVRFVKQKQFRVAMGFGTWFNLLQRESQNKCMPGRYWTIRELSPEGTRRKLCELKKNVQNCELMSSIWIRICSRK